MTPGIGAHRPHQEGRIVGARPMRAKIGGKMTAGSDRPPRIRAACGGTAVAVALCAVAWVGAPAADAATGSGALGAAATITGPITVGHEIEPITAHPLVLSTYGYSEQEFFVSGTAHAYRAVAEPADGRWKVAPTTSAPYETRIIVRRPEDPAKFNGTVVVEWMNESAGESAPDYDYLSPYLLSQGYAYVGVSAQALGVDGGTALVLHSSTEGLVQKEPARYGSLHHPGDQYSYDIFAQIGEALGDPPEAVLGGVRPKHLIAAGESQSAFFLTTYVDAWAPLGHIFDGYFIHSRGEGGAALGGTSAGSAHVPKKLWVRTDLDAPTFIFETQTDLFTLGYAVAQQPDTDRIRTWEVAGTSHADTYEVGGAVGILGCKTTINDGPQHEVAQAAFAALSRWVDDGTPPPSPAPFRLATTSPPKLALDAHGNVIGGVRTPAVDVPVSTLSGAAPKGSSTLCSLFGQTTPFSPTTLTRLYKTKSHYLAEYTASLDKAIGEGYILPADRAELLAQAQQVAFPG